MSFQSFYWIYTCVLLSLAAVRGRVSCDVFWVDAVFALCPVLILVLVVAVRGQTTQNGGSRQLVPAETDRRNDEDCCGTDSLSSGQGLRVRAHTITWEQRWCRAVSQAFVGAAGAALSYWSSALERVATQRYSWWPKTIKDSARLLRKLSANTFCCSFLPAAQSQDGFNSSKFSTAAVTLVQKFWFGPLPSWSGVCKCFCRLYVFA